MHFMLEATSADVDDERKNTVPIGVQRIDLATAYWHR